MTDQPTEDPWAKYISQGAAPTSAPAEDPWAKFVAPTTPPSAEPNAINPQPGAFEQRVQQGKSLLKGWENELKVWSGKQLFSNDVHSVLGSSTMSGIVGGVAATGLGIVNSLVSGATLPHDVAAGRVTDMDELVGRSLDAAGAVMGAPEMAGFKGTHFPSVHPRAPLVDAGNGTAARLEQAPDGSTVAQPVGSFPPKPVDFQDAAKAVSTTTKAVPENVERNMLHAWNEGGNHPAELATAAEHIPALARDLSAGAPPSLPLPDRPSPAYLKEFDDNLFRLKGARTADQAEMMQRLHNVPSRFLDGETQADWYKHGEGDPTANMTHEDRLAWDEHMKPLKEEEAQLWEELQKTDLDVGEYDPNYMHRAVKGRTPVIDRLAGEGTDANPIYNGSGIMSRTTSSMKERKYFALESVTGNRRVVSINKGELRSVGEGEKITHSQEEPIKHGDQIDVGGTPHFVTNAFTREIEGATNVRYYQNALVNTMDNVLHMRSAARAAYEMQRMRSTPEWAAYTEAGRGTGKPRGDDWISPQMPQFKNDAMEPKMAYIIDDFYGKMLDDSLQSRLEKINQMAVGSMFWTPVPHAMNAGAWWAMDRAWDWVKPSGWASLVKNGPRAAYEVITQGKLYQEHLREGSAMMYGGLANRDFYGRMLKSAGMALEKNTAELSILEKIADLPPGQLIKGMYNVSAKALWAVSDIFMMQRVMELKGQGLDTRAAIEHTERFVPNYRVPGTMLGKRSLQQAYTNPNLFQFSRYHYGVMRSYANLARDIIGGTGEQRSHAVGALMAFAAIQVVALPFLSAGLQKITGNDNLKLPSAGPGRLANPLIGMAVNATASHWPKEVLDYYNGDHTVLQELGNLAPIAPLAKMAYEAYPGNNRYSFTGKNIAEPSDIRNGNWGAVAGQEAEHAASTLVEPYALYKELAKAHDRGESIPSKLAEKAFGLSEQTDDARTAREKAFHWQDKAANRRRMKDNGPIENMTGGD